MIKLFAVVNGVKTPWFVGGWEECLSAMAEGQRLFGIKMWQTEA